MGVDTATPEPDPPSRPRLRWWALATFVLAAIPRLYTSGRYLTTDEPTWMERSVRFSDAVTTANLSEATASLGEPATMPGGTTMWIGAVSRGIWRLGVEVGLLEPGSFESVDGLATAQAMMSLVTAALVAVLFVAVSRWVGLVAGLVTAAIVGFGPWWVALGAVLHTDELTALFGTIGLVALAYALGLPTRERMPTRPTLVAIGAGLALMAAAMTKVTGVGFWLGAGLLAAWAVARDRQAGRGLTGPGSGLRLSAMAGLAGVVAVPILWPALLADPLFQLERLGAAAGLSTEEPSRFLRRGPRQYFLGEALDSPGWGYYPVALALRMTPWVFVATVVAVPAAFVWKATRRHALVFAVPLVSLFVVLSASPKKYDRYGLLLLAQLAVIVGVVIQRALQDRVAPRTATRAVAALAAVAFAYSLWFAPWGLAYFNPALGGGRAGYENVLVGWGEGKMVAASRIQELEGGSCDGVVVAGLAPEALLEFPCAKLLASDDADYVLVYVSSLQRDRNPREAVEGRELVDTVEIGGIPYVEIWR